LNFDRKLRSSSLNVATCEVPRTRTSLGAHLLTVAGPRRWNNLELRDSEHTLLAFRRLLKTHQFAEDSDAYNCLLFERLVNLHLQYITNLAKTAQNDVVRPSSCNACNCYVFYYFCACLFRCLSCLLFLCFSTRIIILVIISLNSAWGRASE